MSLVQQFVMIACAVLVFCALSTVPDVYAQSASGQLSGDITDSTGAVIPGANIDARNSETGAESKTVSSSSGHYIFPGLPIGTYQVTVVQPGFQTTVRTGVLVQIGSTAILPITLDPGSVSTTVSVVANGLTLQTESSDVGTVVTPKQVLDLPLSVGNGGMRDPTTFVFLTPATYGVGTAGGSFQSRISGGQQYGSEVLIDGQNFIFPLAGDGSASAALPSVEALNEFKVLIGDWMAEAIPACSILNPQVAPFFMATK